VTNGAAFAQATLAQPNLVSLESAGVDTAGLQSGHEHIGHAERSVRCVIDEQPDDSSFEEIIKELAFAAMVERGVNNIQYDTQSAVLGWQSRFRWIVKPGSDLYFVYTHNWQDDPLENRIYTLDRRAASKVLYTHRF
jgi:hypothetical protein